MVNEIDYTQGCNSLDRAYYQMSNDETDNKPNSDIHKSDLPNMETRRTKKTNADKQNRKYLEIVKRIRRKRYTQNIHLMHKNYTIMLHRFGDNRCNCSHDRYREKYYCLQTLLN